MKAAWGIPILRMKDERGKIIKINSSEPIEIENRYFKGVILPMIKCEGELETFNTYGKHFNNSEKGRKFEIQFQGSLKYIPKGVVVIGAELDNKLELGYITSLFMSTLVSFSMTMNSLLKIGFGQIPTSKLEHEQPHIVFPLFRVMDRVVVTNANETPPILGQELPESDSDRDLRRSGMKDMKFELNRVYSFSFHTSFIDFSQWTLCGFPGYGDIDLRTFLGLQSPHIVVYELADVSIDSQPHILNETIRATSAVPSIENVTKSASEFQKTHSINRKKYITNLHLEYFPRIRGESEQID